MHLAAATVTTERQGGGVSPVLWPEMTLALLKFINGLKDTIVGITVHVRSSGKCGLKTRHQLLAQQWVSAYIAEVHGGRLSPPDHSCEQAPLHL